MFARVTSRVLPLIAIIVLVTSLTACKSSSPQGCATPPDTGSNADCWFGDCRPENGKLPYPNPVQRGGTVRLDVSCGAATRSMQFVSTSFRVYICNAAGQQVSTTTVGPLPPNSNIQQVPIWSNVSVAAGTYFITVVGDIGPCGTKKLVTNFKIVVV